MPKLPEHEERSVRNYVNTQLPQHDQARLVQKIGSRRIMGRVHEMYDVHCQESRWWVITDPTNLYSQHDFHQAEQALLFHLGLGILLAQRSRAELTEADQEALPGPLRRFRQAMAAMDDAGEAADFQSIGIKCRDSLLALVPLHKDSEWVGEVAEPPKAGDFKGWGGIFAERLAEGRVRSYTKSLVERTWDLTVWLQHNSNATPDDAELVLDATGHLLSAIARLIRRHDGGEPDLCPRCGSYRLSEDIEVVDTPERGFLASIICSGCEWQSEQEFTSYRDHFEGTDLVGYLSRPAEGPSDRLTIQPDDD